MKQFPADLKRYFSRLKKNNNKLWYEKHRTEYREKVLEPAMEFVALAGNKIQKFAPKIIADPRVNKSLFRIYRDVRFSKDKTPYKTHLAIFFWEGSAPKLENPGFYMHIDDVEILIGAGLHYFPKNILSSFRESIQNKSTNKKLQLILEDIKKKGFEVGREHYKRMPPGYDSNMKNSHLLLYDGTIKNIVEWSTQCYKDADKLHKWLVKLCSDS